jgi:signal transduction histidine kinase
MCAQSSLALRRRYYLTLITRYLCTSATPARITLVYSDKPHREAMATAGVTGHTERRKNADASTTARGRELTMNPRDRDDPLPRTLFGLDAARLRRGLSALVPGRDVSSIQPIARSEPPTPATFAIEVDREGRLAGGAAHWGAYTGQAERDALGHGFLVAVHPDERATFRTLLQSRLAAGRPFTCTARLFARSPGQHRACQLAGAPLPGKSARWLLIIAEQVTSAASERDERARASAREAELLRTMAEGLLHIINNALQGAVGYTALLHRGPDRWPRLPAQRIDDALARITCAGRKLVIATSDAHSRLALSDLGSALLEWQPLLADVCPPGACLELSASQGQVWVRCDPHGLSEALVHVVRNAVEALPAGGGSVTVRLGQRAFLARELDRAEPPEHVHDGVFAFLEVEDHGSGISAAHLSRVFDPFFSTKFIGRGLGLSMTRGLMRQMGGVITIASTPGQSTRVRLLLPAADRPAC